MRAGPEAILEVMQVGKSYEDDCILRDVNFTVRSGEIAVLVGPSGSGKSTLLRMILGEEFPSEGRVLVDGLEVSGPSSRCGIVFQKYSLFPHLTVRENLCLGVKFLPEYSKSDQAAHVQEMLAGIGLDEDGDKFPYELSGGMQQRVAVGQALIGKPRLLLMDEPFGALDPENRSRCQELLLKVALEERMTVLFTTHDLPEAALVGTRLLVMQKVKLADGKDRSVAHDYDFSLQVPLALRGHRKSREYERLLMKILELTGYSFGSV